MPLVKLITNGVGIISSCGNQKVQGLFSGITGTFGKNIVEFSVWLGMYLIQYQAGNIQTVLGSNLCRQHLIKSIIQMGYYPLIGSKAL